MAAMALLIYSSLVAALAICFLIVEGGDFYICHVNITPTVKGGK